MTKPEQSLLEQIAREIQQHGFAMSWSESKDIARAVLEVMKSEYIVETLTASIFLRTPGKSIQEAVRGALYELFTLPEPQQTGDSK
jgi:hypothetical protein